MALLVGDVLQRAADAVPDRIAATVGTGRLTFAELERSSNRVAHVLAGAGVTYGDRVAWWGDTSLAALPVFGALAKLGAAFAPVNGRLGAAEAGAVVGYARPRLLLVDEERRDAGEEAAAIAGVSCLADLDARAAAASPAPVAEPQLAERVPHVIFFTSGSTGRPKGVVLSHRATVLRSWPAVMADHRGATVCMFPLFHMAGWSMAMNAWQNRQAIHLVVTPDADTLLDSVQRNRATRLYCIPAVWARVLEADRSRYDLSSLVFADTGTSATPPELLAAIREAFPATITRVFYGSTEAGPATMLEPDDVLRKPGSVGLPTPGVEVRLTDDGEVTVRSELLMDGYFEQPDETAAALRDGWYHTGDLGAVDDEGYLSIVGRARDVIRTGGETVAPAEVEAALATHPGVREVAVVGIPDPQWGEIVCAVVVPRDPSAPPTLEELYTHGDGILAGFKRPRRLECVTELPRTAATGQIQRSLIVERIASGSSAG
jgi:acyl-CoA synthetase (AMP-forming)/AMP-acid ligase II